MLMKNLLERNDYINVLTYMHVYKEVNFTES